MHLNFWQNAISFPVFSLPVFLTGAYIGFNAVLSQWGLHGHYVAKGWTLDARTAEPGIALAAFWIACFVLWQACYDLYWQTRLYASYRKYRHDVAQRSR